MTAKSQKGEPEMNFLVPFKTKLSPCCTAEVCNAPASDPASGSVMAKQTAFSARATGKMKRCICAGVAWRTKAPSLGGPVSSPRIWGAKGVPLA